MFHLSRQIVGFALVGALALLPKGVAAQDLTVFAAASLKNALEEVSALWSDETGDELVLSFAGSSQLARQIQQGAPTDIFISANTDWMNTLAEEGLIVDETRVDLLGNSIVLIAHGSDAAAVEIDAGLDLAGLLGTGKLAMALVDAVPAGIYGKAALQSLGQWEGIAPHVAQADNVRAALAFVATGEAPYGIVYATDARADQRVSIVATFPPDSHPPIIYPAAVLRGHDSEQARKFITFLHGEAARAAFEKQGFTPVLP